MTAGVKTDWMIEQLHSRQTAMYYIILVNFLQQLRGSIHSQFPLSLSPAPLPPALAGVRACVRAVCVNLKIFTGGRLWLVQSGAAA